MSAYRCRFDGEPASSAIDFDASDSARAAELFADFREFSGVAWVLVTSDDRARIWRYRVESVRRYYVTLSYVSGGAL